MIDFTNPEKLASKTALAVRKFLETGRGVVLSNFLKKGDPGLELDFHALRNPDRVTITQIGNAMNTLWKQVTSMNPDPVLSDNSIYLRHKNTRGQMTVITNEEAYLFLRDAYISRKEDAAYLKNEAKRKEIQKELDSLKTPEERRKDLEAQLSQLSTDPN